MGSLVPWLLPWFFPWFLVSFLPSFPLSFLPCDSIQMLCLKIRAELTGKTGGCGAGQEIRSCVTTSGLYGIFVTLDQYSQKLQHKTSRLESDEMED